ncbi:MAG TPA: peptide chain release factor N(5)-glutamine methyltransferase, partial [Burkholderiales bacterium]|nr:peptide chain release factor N(5)-glutamine methyltransferase [Burkholderiales bacterium]
IVGVREFWGLEFTVSPAVLIPRPESEFIVEEAVARLGDGTPRVADVGTGSGCIAVSIAHLRPRAQLVATDISAPALALAEANARRHATANVEFRLGDGYVPVAGAQFDVIVANPPYVAAGNPHLELGDLRYEPPHALASGPDGLELMRRLVAEAPRHLRAGGWLLVEHGHDQAEPVRELLEAAGLRDLSSARDLAGMPRAGAGRLTLKP